MGNDDSNYEKEKDLENHSKSMSLEAIEIVLKQMKNCICKIKFNIKGKTGHGTGFLCKIEYDDWSSKRVLITNNHILSKENILPGKEISFSMNNGKIKKKILIEDSRKTYTSKKYDTTIIEINKEDGFKLDSFLEIDNEIYEGVPDEIFGNKPIYLLHYPKGVEVKKSDGLIKETNNENFTIQHF